ncbi:MAG: hypothetical protein H6737_03185 [Alphaproteobacteria bacterium]|nr:hypothetical protein [Alphaproteobacteria bacterium]
MWLLLLAARAEELPRRFEVDAGVAGITVIGRSTADQPVHTGFTLDFSHVYDCRGVFEKSVPDWMKDHCNAFDEARHQPRWLAMLVPEAIYVSPPGLWPGSANTGTYGATWTPLDYGIRSGSRDSVMLTLTAGLGLTTLWLGSDRWGDTFLVRPHLEGEAEVEVPVSDALHFRFDFAQLVFPPQRVGGGPFTFGPLRESVMTASRYSVRVVVRPRMRPFVYEPRY